MSFANEDQKSPQETQDETKASNPVIESKFNHADFESYISIYGNRYDQSEDKIIPMPSESNNMGWRERGTSLPENRDLYSGYWHSKPPVVKPLGEKPSNEELLEPADQATGMSPSFISGSVQTPNVTYGLKQGLFIDNTVSVDDIRHI